MDSNASMGEVGVNMQEYTGQPVVRVERVTPDPRTHPELNLSILHQQDPDYVAFAQSPQTDLLSRVRKVIPGTVPIDTYRFVEHILRDGMGMEFLKDKSKEKSAESKITITQGEKPYVVPEDNIEVLPSEKQALSIIERYALLRKSAAAFQAVKSYPANNPEITIGIAASTLISVAGSLVETPLTPDMIRWLAASVGGASAGYASNKDKGLFDKVAGATKWAFGTGIFTESAYQGMNQISLNQVPAAEAVITPIANISDDILVPIAATISGKVAERGAAAKATIKSGMQRFRPTAHKGS